MLLCATLALVVIVMSTFALLAIANRRWRAARAAQLVSTATMQKMIARHHPSVQVVHAAVARIFHCGDGRASTTDRICVDLQYNRTHDLPVRAMLKTILLPPWQRIGGVATMKLAAVAARLLRPVGLDRLVYAATNLYNFYFPHAPDVMYVTEATFYATLHSEVSQLIDLPQLLGTELDGRRRQWGVLIEDVSTCGARFPTALEEVEVAHVVGLLEQYAKLHAHFWCSPRFEGDLAWVPTVASGGMQPVFSSLGEGLVTDHVRTNEFERQLLAPLGLSVAELWRGLEGCHQLMATPPLTLCHGDAHVQNTYVCADGRAGIFDFQLALRAAWFRDVSYIVGTALSPAQRSRLEERLLAGYLEALRSHGVGAPPELPHARKLYACGMAWGLVIGWLLCPPSNYGEQLLSANIRRLVAACRDLGTFELLGVVKQATRKPHLRPHGPLPASGDAARRADVAQRTPSRSPVRRAFATTTSPARRPRTREVARQGIKASKHGSGAKVS